MIYKFTARDLRTEIERAQDLGRQSNKLGRIFMALTNITMARPEFRTVTVYGHYLRDHLESVSNFKQVYAGYKFKLNRKTSIISYFQVVAYNAILAEIKREKTQKKLKTDITTLLTTNADYDKTLDKFYTYLVEDNNDIEKTFARFAVPRNGGRPKNG